MKKPIIFWSVLAISLLTNVFLLGRTYQHIQDKNEAAQMAAIDTAEQCRDWDTFITALAWVESRWNDLAESPKQAVGYLQLTPILVKDANRILGEEIFSLDSRIDREESIKMFNIIMDNYNPEHDKQLALKIWNPYAKVSYHRAVMAKYNELKSTL